MFLWASLARYAKQTKLFRVICVFIAVQALLTIPVGISMLRDSPDVFYARIHGGPDFENFDSAWVDYIEITKDERGFISTLLILTPEDENEIGDENGQSNNYTDEQSNEQSNNHPDDQTLQPVTVTKIPGNPKNGNPNTGRADKTNENDTVYRVTIAADYTLIDDDRFAGSDFMFAITPEFIFYRDIYTQLVIPATLISAWALEDSDFREIFNHLAIYSNYYTSIVAPVFLLVFFVMLVTQTIIMLAAVWLFGQWVKLSGTMTVRERFFVCTFASVPASLISFAIGLFVPVIHAFIAQLLMIFFSYKAIKEYFNE